MVIISQCHQVVGGDFLNAFFVFVVLLLMGLPIAYAMLATALFGMSFLPNVELIGP